MGPFEHMLAGLAELAGTSARARVYDEFLRSWRVRGYGMPADRVERDCACQKRRRGVIEVFRVIYGKPISIRMPMRCARSSWTWRSASSCGGSGT